MLIFILKKTMLPMASHILSQHNNFPYLAQYFKNEMLCILFILIHFITIAIFENMDTFKCFFLEITYRMFLNYFIHWIKINFWISIAQLLKLMTNLYAYLKWKLYILKELVTSLIWNFIKCFPYFPILQEIIQQSFYIESRITANKWRFLSQTHW